MKRANGSGSIRKLSGNRRKPWAAYRPATYDENGTVHQELIGTYATKKEAEIGLASDYIRPRSEYGELTLIQLWEKWKRTRAFTKLQDDTQYMYSNIFKRYMVDYHDTKFRYLRRDDFQAIIDKADAMKRSKSVMNKIRTVEVILSEYALSLDIVPHSYATKLIIPHREKKKIEIFSAEDIRKLEEDGSEAAETILILIYTGMRISEMLNLKTSDIDINERVIVGGCKTDAGRNRTIPIHRKIYPYILKRMNGQYLIEQDGKPLNYKIYSLPYYETLERLGIERKTPHKARHTFFSMLDAATSDKLAMAMIGGHTDPSFTESVYVHPDLERLRKAMDTI